MIPDVADPVTWDDVDATLDECADAMEKRAWTKLTAVALFALALAVRKISQEREERGHGR